MLYVVKGIPSVVPCFGEAKAEISTPPPATAKLRSSSVDEAVVFRFASIEAASKLYTCSAGFRYL